MAKKTTSKQAVTTITIGLDVGYGVTKAIAPGLDPVLFPSVCGHSREIKFRADELAAKYPGDQITDPDGSWFIGELAQSQIPTGELIKLRGRTADESALGNTFRLRMALAAIGKLLPGYKNGDVVHVQIATGLPVDHMRDAGDLKATLIGSHPVRTDQCDFVANIARVMVMPQPYGTIYRNRLTEAGQVDPCFVYNRTGVCDVGTYTVDLALDDAGEYVDAESGSVEAGVYTAQDRIASAINRDFREKPSHKVVEEVLRTGCLKAHGKTINYAKEVQSALEPLRSATLALLAEKWRTGLNVDVIYLSGGGAALVIDNVKAVYKQAQLVEEAQLANARGYLNYALFAENE